MFGLSSWEPATARVKASRESSKFPIGAGATHGGGAPRPRYEYVVDIWPSGVDAPFTTTMVTPLFIDHWRRLAVGDVVKVLHKPGTAEVKWDRSEPSTSERATRKAAEEARRQSANQNFDAALQAGPGNSPNRRPTGPREVAEALEAARRARGAEIGAPATPWSPAVGFDPIGEAHKQGRTDAFENTLHQAPETQIGVSAGMPGANDPRIAELVALAKANGGAIRLDPSNPETAALREMLLNVAKQAHPEAGPSGSAQG